jgi:hypothetical protein
MQTGLALAAAAALAGWAAPAGWAADPLPLQAQEADRVGVARAFNAAWNAHDVEGVVAVFAPGATIRQTHTRFVVDGPGEGAPDPQAWHYQATEDTYGAGERSLAGAQDVGGWPRGEVVWATGTARIRAWVPWFVAARHRIEASAYQAEGDTVTWRYRAFADPYQQIVGVEPAEGTARVVVHAGRITAFTFDTDEATAARRQRQVAAGLHARLAAAHATAPPAAVVPGASAAPESGLPLALVGAALAGLAVTRCSRRRRRAP